MAVNETNAEDLTLCALVASALSLSAGTLQNNFRTYPDYQKLRLRSLLMNVYTTGQYKAQVDAEQARVTAGQALEGETVARVAVRVTTAQARLDAAVAAVTALLA